MSWHVSAMWEQPGEVIEILALDHATYFLLTDYYYYYYYKIEFLAATIIKIGDTW